MSWSIRPGGPSDAEAVLALWRRSGSVLTLTDDVASIELLLRRDPEALLVAVADGAVIGSLIVGWDGWRGELYRLAVDPSWRRRGVATSLVREGEARLRDLGTRRISAIVMSAHDRARAFWRSMGYEAAPQTRFVRSR